MLARKPGARRFPPKASSTRRRRPGAFQLTRPSKDRVFDIGLDLPRNRRLGPLPVRCTLLAVHGHRQGVRPQCTGQDKNVDPVADVRVARRRIPISDDRAGKGILRGVFDEIQRVMRRLPQDRAYRPASLWPWVLDRIFLGEAEYRQNISLGIDFLGFARSRLLRVRGARRPTRLLGRLFRRRTRRTRGEGQ
jgi:hypothetical protein